MTAGSFLAFAIFGVIDVLKGSTLSAMLKEMGFSYSTGGIIVMAAYFGFVVSTLSTGVIADYVGRKAVLIIAAVFYIVGMTGYAAAGGIAFFMFSYFCIGFGCGAVELGSNHIIIDVQTRNSGRYLNLLATFYGVGSMLAPLYAGQLFKAGFTWRDIYLFGLAMPVVLLLFFLLARYPTTAASRPGGMDFRLLFKSAFTWKMWLLYILVFAYVASEVCVATWLVEYLLVLREIPMETGAFWLSLYFAGLMVGRFVGSFVVERLGYVRMMIIAVVLSIASIMGGVFGPDGLSFLLPLTGLFFSIILPTATAVVSTIIKVNIGTILGVFFCFVGLGGMAGPWLQGLANDCFGIRIGMTTPAFFCLLMLICLILISVSDKNKRNAE